MVPYTFLIYLWAIVRPDVQLLIHPAIHRAGHLIRTLKFGAWSTALTNYHALVPLDSGIWVQSVG